MIRSTYVKRIIIFLLIFVLINWYRGRGSNKFDARIQQQDVIRVASKQNIISFLNNINAFLVQINVLKSLFETQNNIIDASIFDTNRPLVFGIVRNFGDDIKSEIQVRELLLISNCIIIFVLILRIAFKINTSSLQLYLF